MNKVTFVTPRYGAAVLGGAESGARSLAEGLARDGWEVDVLTSCATSSVTWANDYEAGLTLEGGVNVSRFAVARPRDPKFDEFSNRILPAPHLVSRSEALEWIDQQGPDSPDLLDAVEAVDRGVVSLYPYLYQPTVRGQMRAQVPTILHAAAHHEAPLGLPVFDDLFGAVDGLAHHSTSEQELVLHRFRDVAATPQVVLGLPVDAPPPDHVDEAAIEAARSEFGLGDRRFMVCLGRVDRGKGTDDLVERYRDMRARGGPAVDLVLAGPVVHQPPPHAGVHVVGPVDEKTKWALLAGADLLINPSPHESFSLVILEAWLAGTAVVVNALCGPTVEHCRRSGGGLWYVGAAQFDAVTARLLKDHQSRARLAAAGRHYVETTFEWPAVRRRFEQLMRACGHC